MAEVVCLASVKVVGMCSQILLIIHFVDRMRCQLKERARSRAHVMSSSLRSKRIYKHNRSCLGGLCKRCWYVFLLPIHPIHHAPGLLFKPSSPNVYQRLQHIVYQLPTHYLPTTPADCLPTTRPHCLPTIPMSTEPIVYESAVY